MDPAEHAPGAALLQQQVQHSGEGEEGASQPLLGKRGGEERGERREERGLVLES